jgi:hypothetical protein
MEHFPHVRSSGLTSVICGCTSPRHHTHWYPPPHFYANLERSHQRSHAKSVQCYEPAAGVSSHANFTGAHRSRQRSLPQAGFEPRGHRDRPLISFPNNFLTSKSHMKHRTIVQTLIAETQDVTPRRWKAATCIWSWARLVHFPISQPISCRLYLNGFMSLFSKRFLQLTSVHAFLAIQLYLKHPIISQSPRIYYFNDIRWLYKSRYMLANLLHCYLLSIDFRFITVLLHPVLRQINPLCNLTLYVLKIRFNIVLSKHYRYHLYFVNLP